MATYYFDPDGGNDANDGLSFANRKKTWGGLAPANGDELRIMAARDPHSLGDVTWTNGSNSLTLASAKNVTLDNANTAWTPSTNVVATLQTTSMTRVWKEGTNCARLAVNATFTTGVIGYKALGATLDLSAYRAISMKIGHSVAIASGVLILDLCSDAVGAVPVASIPLPTGTLTSTGYNIFADYGAALPSNVNSIALRLTTDFGAVNIDFDNIIACHELGHADHLCHDSMIGKETVGEPEMWPIKSIDGTTVVLGAPETTGTAMGRQYAGATETVTTYAQQTQVLLASPAAFSNNGATFAITGGWDRTAMTTQSGETFLSGRLFCATPFSRISPSHSISKVSYTGFISGITTHTTLTGKLGTVQGKHASGNVVIVLLAENFSEINLDYMVMNTLFGYAGTLNPYNLTFQIKSKLWGECNVANRGFWDGTSVIPFLALRQTSVELGTIRNCAVAFGGTSAASCQSLKNTAFVGNGSDFPLSTYDCSYFLDNCTFSWSLSSGSFTGGGSLTFTRRNGDPRLNGYDSYMLSCDVQTAVAPATGDTAAWAFCAAAGHPNTANTWPRFVIDRIEVEAGKTYTINYDVRRTHASAVARMSALNTDGTRVSADTSPTINTWAAGTALVITAAADGVIDLEWGIYTGQSGTARTVYAANITVAVS